MENMKIAQLSGVKRRAAGQAVSAARFVLGLAPLAFDPVHGDPSLLLKPDTAVTRVTA